MNTYEYIMERKRMCDSFGSKCKGCPAEHPKKQKKTRQDVFLNKYPEANLDRYGVLDVCPSYVSADYRDKNGECFLLYTECCDCRATFWMAEVKEDK